MISRRQLLERAGAAGLAAGMGLATALQSFPARAADVSGYKALVCIYLGGGQDCHDFILPYDQNSYTRYAQIRQLLLQSYADHEGRTPDTCSRARGNLLELQLANPIPGSTRGFALSPNYPLLHGLFHSGKAAVVANVGPLTRHITRAAYVDNSIPKPLRLFSHNDQTSTWQSFQVEGAQIGWGGRFADVALASGANTDPVFTSLSVSGNVVFLAGQNARQYQMSDAAIRELQNYALLGSGQNSQLARTLIEQHFRSAGATRGNLFERDIVNATARSIDANAVFRDAKALAPPLNTAFPGSQLGAQLRAIAEAISARSALGANRQVFFANATSGFDTHAAQAVNLPRLQTEVDGAMAAFYAAMVELGLENQVVQFTASDFGRTLTVNGDGTDHGWGGHHLVVGGAVDGRKMFGVVPPYDLDHDFDAGHGRLIPTLAVQQYAATLGRWFGLSSGELHQALPGLSHFDEFAAPFL
jgi:uncharacterized protein (DUF1501 family)